MRDSLLPLHVASHSRIASKDMTAGPPAIALRAVSKRYGDAVALQPLDLEIREGEFFCLLGPSGCGKTTTLNLLGGFVAPTSGEIHLRGARIDQLPPHRRPVNTVFQSYALFPHMTVRANVALRAARWRASGRRRRRSACSRALERVGVSELAERMPDPALGRPAAAGRGGARARQRAGRAAARRAARGARPEAPPAAADRARGDPPRGRHHVRVRHARPGGGDGARRPHRGHERRTDRAGGDAARDLPAPAQPRSSPTSSARRTCSTSCSTAASRDCPTARSCPRRHARPARRRSSCDPSRCVVSREGEGLPARLVHTSFLGQGDPPRAPARRQRARVTASIAGSDRGRLEQLELDQELRVSWHEDDAVVLLAQPQNEEGHDA